MAAALALMVFGYLPAAVRSVWGIGVVTVFVHALVDYPMQQRPAISAWVFVMMGAAAACVGDWRRRAGRAEAEGQRAHYAHASTGE
jgi:hypothetical protein